jgi:hypothetical protein
MFVLSGPSADPQSVLAKVQILCQQEKRKRKRKRTRAESYSVPLAHEKTRVVIIRHQARITVFQFQKRGVSFSSTLTTKRFPLRCASGSKIIRADLEINRGHYYGLELVFDW